METELVFQTLIEFFNQSLLRTEPDKPCLEIVRTQRQEALTFGRLKTRAQDFALWLIQDRDIGIGDKIAILGKNRADWDVALWGIILAGAVPVLIDPERPVEGVKKHLISTDTRLLVMADDYQDANSQGQLKEHTLSGGLDIIEMTVHEKIDFDGDAADELLNGIHSRIKSDDTAVMLCTSGTTGDPREVELTHANLIANIWGTLDVVKITSEDKLGHVTPPHHSFGLTVGKLLPFWVGATNVYTNKYRHVAQLIKEKSITLFVGIPALFAVIARRIEEGLNRQKEESVLVRILDRYLPGLVGKRIVKKLGWENLRFAISGAAPVPRWVLEVFWRRGLQLREGYGTTENSPVYGLNADRKKLGSVGRPISTLLVKTVNEKNETLRTGEKGEIVLGGPCIMKGYYKNPTATQAVIKTDDKGIRWLHTGDLGYLDEDGCLYITGRKKYLIVLPGGKNVNPELVESVLSQAEYVEEVLVVPGLQRDSAERTEEAIRAIVRPAWEVIQTDTNLSYSDLVKQPQALKKLVWQNINECQQQSRFLSGFEKVSSQHLEVRIDEFQKTSTGKIKRDLYIKIPRK
ncbi:MAG: class I adenylate-forming enzyme family protein [Planctomycetota bacterium]|jgi:long-chain acyl-CoA synthetase